MNDQAHISTETGSTPRRMNPALSNIWHHMRCYCGHADCGNIKGIREHIEAVEAEAALWKAEWEQISETARLLQLRLAPEPREQLPAQADVLGWAVRSFGPIAQNIDERAARVAEEAIEIAQVEGVPLETIIRIAERVYSRPAGERWQEIGGTMIGLLSYAEIIGLSLTECAHREFQRVLSKPRDWWTKKHAEKVAAGTANLSPTKEE